MSESIQSIYRDVLSRDPNQQDLQYWQNALNSGSSYQDVRSALAHGDEAATDIGAAWEEILEREPTASEFGFDQDDLASGSTFSQVRNEIANLSETTNKIDAAYEEIADRDPTASELGFDQLDLASGSTFSQVRNEIAHLSDTADRISTVYEQILQREPDSTETQGKEAELASGASFTDIRGELASSDEAANDIKAAWESILGREPTASEFGFDQLDLASGSTFAQVRNEIAHLAETTTDLTAAYEQILQREPDSTEIQGKEAELASGTSFTDVRNELASSDEAVKYITAAWEEILGRAPGASELGFDELDLASGSSFTAIRSEIAHSTESAVNIQAAFQTYLGRDATPTDIDYWESQLTSGSSTLASMSLSIKNSAPAVAPEVISAIRSDYAQILGRNPNGAELADKENEYSAGSSLDQIRTEIGHSAEAVSNIQSAFQTYLGRDATTTEVDDRETQLTSGDVTLTGMDQAIVNTTSAAADVVAAIQSDYQQILGRAADATGLAEKQVEVANGTTLASVQSEIATSFEAVSDIQSVFLTYLGRAATSIDITYWESHFADGSVTLASMIQQFKDAAQTAPTNQPTADAPPGSTLPAINTGLLSEEAEIDELYREILGRSGQGQEIAGKEVEIAGGASWTSIRNELAFGTEATQDIESLYEQILGREATADELQSKQEDLGSGSTLDRTRTEIEHLPEALLLTGTNSGLVLEFTEQAWMGDAQFTISVDGVQAGGVYTSGSPFNGVNQVQAVIPDALLGVGSHNVQFTFINDADGGSPTADRNLYLLGAWLGGQQISGASGALLTNSSVSFGVTIEVSGVDTQQDVAIANVFDEVTGGQIDQTTADAADDAIDDGVTIGDIRDTFAHSSAAGQAIDALYREVLNRGATSSEISGEENSLSAGGTLLQFRRDLAVSSEVAAELSEIYHDVNNVNIDGALLTELEAQIANGRPMADIRPSLAFTDTIRNTIDQLYVDQVGRQATGDEIVYWQARLADGEILGNVTDGNSVSVAGTIAFYGQYTFGGGEDNTVFQNVILYENLASDPATDRAAGYAPENSPLTLVGSDGQTIAVTDARSLLALLPVYVTMNGGQSPNLKLADGRLVLFNDTVVHGNVLDAGSNAEQLAGYLLRTAQHSDSIDPLLANSYAQTTAWLEQVDQPALQAAVYYAVMSQMYTASGDSNRALEARTASALALQIASQDPSARSASLTSQITAFGHPVQITVSNFGDASFHDVDNSIIVQIIDAVVTIAANLAVFIPGTQEFTIPLAIAVDTANAGLALSNGNVLGAVLSLAGAAAQGLSYASFLAQNAGNVAAAQGYAAASQIVSAAAQITGGTYGLITGAENGDPAAILGGVLEVAGGVAAGLAPVQGITSAAAAKELGVSDEVFGALRKGLAAAGALTSFGASVSNGDLTGGLLNSLLPWLANLAADSVANGSQSQGRIDVGYGDSNTSSDTAGRVQDFAGTATVNDIYTEASLAAVAGNATINIASGLIPDGVGVIEWLAGKAISLAGSALGGIAMAGGLIFESSPAGGALQTMTLPDGTIVQNLPDTLTVNLLFQQSNGVTNIDPSTGYIYSQDSGAVVGISLKMDGQGGLVTFQGAVIGQVREQGFSLDTGYLSTIQGTQIFNTDSQASSDPAAIAEADAQIGELLDGAFQDEGKLTVHGGGAQWIHVGTNGIETANDEFDGLNAQPQAISGPGMRAGRLADGTLVVVRPNSTPTIQITRPSGERIYIRYK